MSDVGYTAQNAGNWLRIDNSGSSLTGGRWWEQLQPGSWRGVPFVTEVEEAKAGRRVAVHEYPYRDTVWPEDIGKLPRRYQFTAFLVGDDCYQQRDRMVAACETAGEGELVHPTFGAVTVVLLDATFTERQQRGRVVEINFQFIDAGSISPSSAIATGFNVLGAADGVDRAASLDLQRVMGGLDPHLPNVAEQSWSGFGDLAIDAVNDPGRSLSAVTGLQGFYGRYGMGNRSTVQPSTATVSSALAGSIESRQRVLDAVAHLQALAEAF